MAINFPSAPSNGQVYSDSATGLTWVYNGSGWSTSFTRSNYVAEAFTATAGQDTFTVSGGYLAGLLDVYQNGVKLVVGTDVTATNGTTIVLTTPAQFSDVIEVRGLSTFSVANTVPLTGGIYTGTVTATVVKASTPFIENSNTVTDSYTISAGYNAISAGPVTINSGVTVTIPDSSTWSIV